MKAIFKSVMALMAACTFAACSDVPMPYDNPNNSEDSTQTAGVYLDESFASDFGKFTPYTVKGTAWAIDYSTAKATGYDNNSKETTESEAYIVSSPIDLSKSTGAYLQFDYILRYVRAGQTENKVIITDNYTGDPTTTTWTDITGTMTEGSDWITFSTYKKNLPATFIGKSNVVVALMYSCTTTSSTIEVKNLTLKEGSVDETGGDTPQPSATGLNATFEASDEGFTIHDISLSGSLTYVWKYDATNHYMKAGAYAGGKNNPAQSMIVSPAFSLEGLSNATLTYDQAAKYIGNAADELQVLASTDGNNWTKLTPSTYPTGDNWNFVSTTCDMSAFAGKKTVYIAFQYTSTEDAAPTWQVKNVVVK